LYTLRESSDKRNEGPALLEPIEVTGDYPGGRDDKHDQCNDQRAIDPPEVLLAPEVSLEPTLLLRILPVQRALIHPAKLTERDVLMLSAPDALFAPGVPPRHGRFLACTAEFGPGIHNRTALV